MNPPPNSARRRQTVDLVSTGLMMLLPAIACRKIIVFSLLNRPASCAAFNQIVLDGSNAAYNRGILAVNFVDHGFIRRGLGGTILRLLGRSPLTRCADPLILFHAASALWLAVPLVLLARRVAQPDGRYGLWLAVLLAGSPQLFWAWGGDLGRVDMLTGGCIAWAVVSALGRCDTIAIALILLGSLAHETCAIFGLPLLAVLRSGADGESWVRRLAPVAAAAALLALVFLCQHLFTRADRLDIVQAILRSEPPSYLRDVAAYMTSDGGRNMVTSWCQSLGRAATPFYLACVLLLILAYALLLAIRRADGDRLVVAVLLPTIVTSVLAIDYGRWLIMATLNAWLFASAAAIGEGVPPLSIRALATRLGGLTLLFAMKPTLVYSPNHFAEYVAARIWGEQATKLRRIGTCDPAWRTSLGLPAEADYPVQGGIRTRLFDPE